MHMLVKVNRRLTQSTRGWGRGANLDGLGLSKHSLNKRARGQASSNQAQHCTTASLRLNWSLLSSNTEPRACHTHPAAAAAAQSG